MTTCRKGYTLVEVLIATALAAGVILGIFLILTSIVHFQVESARRSTVDAWAITGVVAMNKEIEASNSLVYPTAANATGTDSLTVCQNWSNLVSTTLDYNNPTITVTSYCYDGTASGSLMRRRTTGTGAGVCPGAGTAPPACSAANGYEVIATNVNRLDATNPNVFLRDDTVSGVRLRFTVGNPNPDLPGSGRPVIANPQTLSFDTKISMTKSPGNNVD